MTVTMTVTVTVKVTVNENPANSAGLGVEHQAAVLVDMPPTETSAAQSQIPGYDATLELSSGQTEDFIRLRAGHFGHSCDECTENLRPHCLERIES